MCVEIGLIVLSIGDLVFFFVESGGTTWIVPTFWEGVESLSYSEVALEVGRLVVSMAEIRSMPRQCRISGH